MQLRVLRLRAIYVRITVPVPTRFCSMELRALGLSSISAVKGIIIMEYLWFRVGENSESKKAWLAYIGL